MQWILWLWCLCAPILLVSLLSIMVHKWEEGSWVLEKVRRVSLNDMIITGLSRMVWGLFRAMFVGKGEDCIYFNEKYNMQWERTDYNKQPWTGILLCSCTSKTWSHSHYSENGRVAEVLFTKHCCMCHTTVATGTMQSTVQLNCVILLTGHNDPQTHACIALHCAKINRNSATKCFKSNYT